MNQIAEESLLFDFYGSLLTEKKQRAMQLYNEENMSLAEIAQDCNISRSAVYDSIKKAERQLQEYEKQLGLVKAYFRRMELVDSLKNDVKELTELTSDDTAVSKLLKKINQSLEELSKEE